MTVQLPINPSEMQTFVRSLTVQIARRQFVWLQGVVHVRVTRAVLVRSGKQRMMSPSLHAAFSHHFHPLMLPATSRASPLWLHLVPLHRYRLNQGSLCRHLLPCQSLPSVRSCSPHTPCRVRPLNSWIALSCSHQAGGPGQVHPKRREADLLCQHCQRTSLFKATSRVSRLPSLQLSLLRATS